MKKSNQRQALFASTILCGAAVLGATQANAQAAAAASNGSQVQEVVVTGSRIPRANLESASPLTVVTAGEVKAEGVVNIESLLNNLPSVVSGQTSSVSNGSTGTATVDLRGLGPVRTLVLIDGRRLQPGDPSGGTPGPVPDLNFIPAPLVERVDVLTGGASSEYGADAVAGVVNFIMKRDFEGIQIDAQYGFDQHENGNSDAAKFLAGNAAGPIKDPGDVVERNNSQVSIIMGANSPDNKGNVTAYAEYTNLQPILQSTRDYSACSTTDSTSLNGVVNGRHICAGSSNSAFGRFNLTGQFETIPGTNNPVLNAAGNKIGVSPLTNFGAAPGTFANYSPAASFNFGPQNYFQRSDDRYNLGAFGHYQANEHVDLYMDAMFMDDHTTAQIAPSGFFQTSGTYFIPCNNAFLSSGQASQLGCGSSFEGGGVNAPAGTPAGTISSTIGYRFADQPRQDDLRHTDYRIVIGAKGDISEGWNYDVYAQYGASIYAEHYLNDASITKLQNALNTVGTGSTATCVVGGACVPIDIFSAAGPSKAALNYVLTPGFKEGQTTEEVVEADVNGDLGQYGLKSPFAKEGVKIALGTDYRREELDEEVDNEFATGDLSGQGGPTPSAAGSFNVYEVYGELNVPIITDMPFIKDLNFDGGYRYSEYDDVGQTETYKLALEYAPVEDIKFRGSFNHAVRAPNVDELFQPDTVGLFSGADPCSGSAPVASLAACERSGVTAGQYGLITPCPASQCNALTGGNSVLKPEASDTTSLGVVFTPTFIRNFSLTVDFYNIRVNNIIQGVAPNVSLDDCLAGDLTFCSLVHRDANGSIGSPTGYIISTNQNTGYLQTKGYDFEVNYRFKLSDVAWGGMAVPDWGAVSMNFLGTYTESFVDQPVTGGGTYNCAGLYGPVCGNPDPHWRHKMRITWTTPWNFDISGQWRYVGGVKLDTNEGNPLLANGYFDAVDGHLRGYNYFDMSGNWRVKDGLTVRAGVSNIFDTDPPIVATAACQTGVCNGNTYPGVYDALGREFFLALTAKF
jgi:iron complex outermembrane recepter protein